MMKGRFARASGIFLLALVIFSLAPFHATNDTLPNMLLPISVIYEHDLDFNEFVSNTTTLPYWYSEVNGRIVSNYPIIPGLMNLPVYLAAHLLGVELGENIFSLTKISSELIAALSAAFMFLALEKVLNGEKEAVFFSLIYAFATGLWSTASRGIWQHGPSMLLLSIALYLLLSKDTRLVSCSGFFLGFAVFNRPTNLLITLPLAFYVYLHHRRAFKGFLLNASIPAVLLLIYSHIYWGSLFSLGQGQGLSGFNSSFFLGFAGLLVSPSRGLLVFSPIFTFSLAQMTYSLYAKDEEPIYRYLATAPLLLILAYSKWRMWWGGWSFGYRLLLETVPILILFLALSWTRVISKSRPLRLVFLLFLLFSLYTHYLGAFYYPCGFDEFTGNIDLHPERLWSVANSQIAMCTEKLLEALG